MRYPLCKSSDPCEQRPAVSSVPVARRPRAEAIPIAKPEPVPASGVPVELQADRQTWAEDTWTGTGGVVVHYRDYIIRADKVVYHRKTYNSKLRGTCR